MSSISTSSKENYKSYNIRPFFTAKYTKQLIKHIKPNIVDNKVEDISIIHQNIQSIGNSVDKINYMLQNNPECKILCFCEHWKSMEQLEKIKINNFRLQNKYCREAG